VPSDTGNAKTFETRGRRILMMALARQNTDNETRKRSQSAIPDQENKVPRKVLQSNTSWNSLPHDCASTAVNAELAPLYGQPVALPVAFEDHFSFDIYVSDILDGESKTLTQSQVLSGFDLETIHAAHLALNPEDDLENYDLSLAVDGTNEAEASTSDPYAITSIVAETTETVGELALAASIDVYEFNTDPVSDAYQPVQRSQKKRPDLGDATSNRPVLEGCGLKCRKQCSTRFTAEERVSINRQFWDKPNPARRQFLFDSAFRQPVQRRTAASLKRNASFYYYLISLSGSRVSVCKTFFLTTLGYQYNSDKVLMNVLRKTEMGAITPKPDMRGKAPATNKIDRDLLRAHVESFCPTISHYRREHAPHRRYLPSELNVTALHSDFVKKHPNVTCSYDVYRKVVNEMNIAFTKLGHEECEQCKENELHQAATAHIANGESIGCDACQNWERHQRMATESREEYRRDAAHDSSNEFSIYSADLQKVLMLPRMEQFKAAIFTRRLVVFNETFVPTGTKQHCNTVAVTWHEATAGRKKEDLVSAFHAFFIARRDAKRLTLWLDNCAAQNKNWTLFSFLIYIVNSAEICCDEITLKYFEPGHTFMSADSFHHQVELSMKRQGTLYDFADFCEAVRTANSGRVDLRSLEATDFSNWCNHSSIHKINKTNPRPYLSQMVCVTALRGSKSLTYKRSFDSEPLELNFLTTVAFKQGIEKAESRSIPRGITQAKKDDIIAKLLSMMPEGRRSFWLNLPAAEVADLSQYDE